jgi:hypothetical protein
VREREREIEIEIEIEIERDKERKLKLFKFQKIEKIGNSKLEMIIFSNIYFILIRCFIPPEVIVPTRRTFKRVCGFNSSGGGISINKSGKSSDILILIFRSSDIVEM